MPRSGRPVRPLDERKHEPPGQQDRARAIAEYAFSLVGHEAGHAVVALALGKRLEAVTANVWHASGAAEFALEPGQRTTRDVYFRELTVLVAGDAAESLLPGVSVVPQRLSERIEVGEIKRVTTEDVVAAVEAGEGDDLRLSWLCADVILREFDGRRPTNKMRARVVADAEGIALAVLKANFDAWKALNLALHARPDKTLSGCEAARIAGVLTLPTGLEAKGAASDNGTRGGKGKAGGGRGGRCAAKWS